jgi:hypothetical protein
MLWERCGWTCPRFLRATRRADRAHPIRLSKDLRPGVQKSTILHRKFDPSVSNGLARAEIRCKSPPCRMLALFGPHAMSDWSPEYAPKRTSADHTEFMGSRPGRPGRPALPQRRTRLSRDCLESVALPPDGAFCDVIGTTRFDFRETSFVLSRQRFFSKKAIARPSRHRRKQTTASRAETINNANKRNSVVAKPNRRGHSTSETMLCNAPFRLEVFRFYGARTSVNVSGRSLSPSK